jgi:hypothetical protein
MLLVTAENFQQARAAYGDEYLILNGVAPPTRSRTPFSGAPS